MENNIIYTLGRDANDYSKFLIVTGRLLDISKKLTIDTTNHNYNKIAYFTDKFLVEEIEDSEGNTSYSSVRLYYINKQYPKKYIYNKNELVYYETSEAHKEKEEELQKQRHAEIKDSGNDAENLVEEEPKIAVFLDKTILQHNLVTSVENGELIKYNLLNGNIECINRYKDNKLDGIQEYYSENGKNLVKKENFVMGQLEGETLEYYDPENTLFVSTMYVHNKLDGTRRKYYPNGKLWVEDHFVDDHREGILKAWYENGIQSIERTYKNSVYHGSVKQWSEKGFLECDEQYINGELDKTNSKYYRDTSMVMDNTEEALEE